MDTFFYCISAELNFYTRRSRAQTDDDESALCTLASTAHENGSTYDHAIFTLTLASIDTDLLQGQQRTAHKNGVGFAIIVHSPATITRTLDQLWKLQYQINVKETVGGLSNDITFDTNPNSMPRRNSSGNSGWRSQILAGDDMTYIPQKRQEMWTKCIGFTQASMWSNSVLFKLA